MLAKLVSFTLLITHLTHKLFAPPYSMCCSAKRALLAMRARISPRPCPPLRPIDGSSNATIAKQLMPKRMNALSRIPLLRRASSSILADDDMDEPGEDFFTAGADNNDTISKAEFVAWFVAQRKAFKAKHQGHKSSPRSPAPRHGSAPSSPFRPKALQSSGSPFSTPPTTPPREIVGHSRSNSVCSDTSDIAAADAEMLWQAEFNEQQNSSHAFFAALDASAIGSFQALKRRRLSIRSGASAMGAAAAVATGTRVIVSLKGFASGLGKNLVDEPSGMSVSWVTAAVFIVRWRAMLLGAKASGEGLSVYWDGDSPHDSAFTAVVVPLVKAMPKVQLCAAVTRGSSEWFLSKWSDVLQENALRAPILFETAAEGSDYVLHGVLAHLFFHPHFTLCIGGGVTVKSELDELDARGKTPTADCPFLVLPLPRRKQRPPQTQKVQHSGDMLWMDESCSLAEDHRCEQILLAELNNDLLSLGGESEAQRRKG